MRHPEYIYACIVDTTPGGTNRWRTVNRSHGQNIQLNGGNDVAARIVPRDTVQGGVLKL